MKLWLVGLGLALLSTVNALSECSGDHSQMYSKWYTTAIATDCEHLLEKKDTLKILAADLTFKTDSEIHITTNLPEKDGCKEIKVDFKKMEDGTYYHTADWGSMKLVEFVSTDCKTYILCHSQIEHNGKTSNHIIMYTREPELTSELKEKFLESVRKSSVFTSDQIIMPHKVACQDEE